MHIANFLDLERSLQTRRILVASAHDQQALRVRQDSSRKLLQSPILLEDSLDLTGECMETVDDLIPAFGERDSVFGKLESHHQESDVLRGIRLSKESGQLSGPFFGS
jgi:hypothetical protein